MNTVSKLLIVLILFLSVMFLGFSAAIYSTQKNWKKLSEDTATKLKDSGDREKIEKDKYDNLFKANGVVIKNLEEQVANEIALRKTAETTLEEIKGKPGVEGSLNKVETERDRALAEAAVAAAEADARRQEALEGREQLRKLSDKNNELTVTSRKQSDEILDLSRKLQRAEASQKTLLGETARLTSLLRANKVALDTKVDQSGKILADGREPDGIIGGEVLKFVKSPTGATQFVEISIGEDDGVEIGHRLHISRGRNFIADIIIREVNADDAVGVVDMKLPPRPIQRGDNVTSKL